MSEKDEKIKDFFEKMVTELKIQEPQMKRSEFTNSCAKLDKEIDAYKNRYNEDYDYYMHQKYNSFKDYSNHPDSYLYGTTRGYPSTYDHRYDMADDIRYTQDKLMASLKVPEKYLGYTPSPSCAQKMAPKPNPYLDYHYEMSPKKETDFSFHIMKNRDVKPKEEIKMMNTVKAAADVVESTLSKEITSGISEEVIAYGLVHALSKQGEAIVGVGDLPLIKMTPSMLVKIREHLETELSNLKRLGANAKGQQHRLKNYYEALIALTER